MMMNHRSVEQTNTPSLIQDAAPAQVVRPLACVSACETDCTAVNPMRASYVFDAASRILAYDMTPTAGVDDQCRRRFV